MSMPDEKKRKYDRQLRIWGENGQAALESARVCLINGGCLGTETIKNLVLPGIGAVTIVDGNLCVAEDLGNNFFVTEEHLGQPRAKVAAEMLQELNPDDADVSKWVHEDPGELLARSPEFFDEFSAVVATQLGDEALRALGRRCWANGVPLIVAKICGFIGYTRVVMPELCIVESKPENIVQDLRIPAPFAELTALADTVDVDAEDSTEHSHVPWLFILLKALEEWRADPAHAELPEDGGRHGPVSFAQKKQFKLLVKSKNRGMEENFEEALSQAHYAYAHPKVPDEVQAILMDPRTSNISADGGATGGSTSFWVAMRALRTFVEANGCLPLAGGIPDMTAATALYIALQQAYQKKATGDIAAVSEAVRLLVEEHGCEPLTEEFITSVCKNASHLRVKRFASLEKEYGQAWALPLAPLLDGSQSFDGTLDKNAVWYLMLRASECFVSRHGRTPGRGSAGAPTADIPLLRAELQGLLEQTSGLTQAQVAACMSPLEGAFGPVDPVAEMCRVGGAELHPTAALMGGMVSQELIKVLTTQFVPVDGGFLMNMMDNTATKIPFSC